MIILGDQIRLTDRENRQIAFLCNKKKGHIQSIYQKDQLICLLEESLSAISDTDDPENGLKAIYLIHWLEQLSAK